MLKKIRKPGIFLILAIVAIGFFLFRNLTKPDILNIVEMEPQMYLAADTLISHFKNGEESPLKPESIVEMEGVIKEINGLNGRLTILLEGGESESPSIICDMQADQKEIVSNLKPKDTVRVKGVFKGLLKDAVFLNCIISDNQRND